MKVDSRNLKPYLILMQLQNNMKFICLQAGHQNTQDNCNINLRGSTGAPGEVEFTVRVRDRLSQILISKDFQVQLVDANFNCNPERAKDFDLFLAIHYEADVHGIGGGCVGSGDASVDDNWQESARIRDCIREEYFKNSGIDEHEEWINPNITHYYMWSVLSSKTPGVLIECGVGLNAHDKVILADTDRVANAIARGICKAFAVPFDPPQPPPPPQPDYKQISEDLQVQLNNSNLKIDALQRDLDKAKALATQICNL